MTALADPPQSPSRQHGRGFWLVAFAFAMTMAFSTAPAPLYVFYEQEQGFGAFTVTVIFATYGVGVALSLYLAGHLSDRFGRRRILAPAILLNVLAALVFLTTHELGWLLLARLLSGLGVGMLTATATAHIAELHRRARPAAPSTRAEVVATAANIGGLGTGALVAGFLAEWAPRPLYTPYLVFAVLMVVGLLGVVTTPETVEVRHDEWRYRPQQVAVPAGGRAAFWAAAMAAFVAFAMFGLFTSLAPSFLAGPLHHSSHALAGAISFSVFGSSALLQIVTAGWRTTRLYAAGLVALAVGLLLVVGAILATQLGLLVAAGIVAGAGAGMTFKAAVATSIAIAPEESRGEVLAGLFLMAYFGITVPVVGLGVLVQFVATDAAVITFAAVLLALLGVAAGGVAAARRR